MDVFEELIAQTDATSETARALLLDMDRTTLYRIRRGKVTPTLEVALKMADRLGTTVEKLFEVAL